MSKRIGMELESGGGANSLFEDITSLEMLTWVRFSLS
jgi:hypothetical protein